MVARLARDAGPPVDLAAVRPVGPSAVTTSVLFCDTIPSKVVPPLTFEAPYGLPSSPLDLTLPVAYQETIRDGPVSRIGIVEG